MIPTLHIITDDQILSRIGFVSLAGEVMEEGGRAVAFHLRGPRTTGRDLFSLARALKGPAEAFGSRLVVNDRLDLALALNLSGAHLGQRSLPPEVARRILGPASLLGLSVHTAEEARMGAGGRVDYLLVGTIYPSPSHPGVVPGGTARIREICSMSDVPCLAIGGITRDRISEARGAGAYGVAVRGGIWDARDPTAATRVYLEKLEERWDT